MEEQIIKILNEFARPIPYEDGTAEVFVIPNAFFPAIAEKIANGWVKVEERLPETSFEVLITDGSRSAIASYDDLVGWGIMGAVYFEPTHWMPLPTPPNT